MTEAEVIEKLKFFKETIIALKKDNLDKDLVIEEQRSQIDDLKKSFESCEAIVNEKVGEISYLNETINKNNKLLETFEEEDNEYRNLIETQKLEIENLKKELESSNEKYDNILKKSQECESREIVLNKEIHKKDFQINELSNEIENLKSLLKEKDDEIKNKSTTAEIVIKEGDLNSLINYNFGKTTESVKNAFVKFVEALYENSRLDGEEYILSSWSEAAKKSGVSSKAASVFSNRLTSMEYKNSSLIRETEHGLISEFEKDFIIKYCTTIVSDLFK